MAKIGKLIDFFLKMPVKLMKTTTAKGGCLPKPSKQLSMFVIIFLDEHITLTLLLLKVLLEQKGSFLSQKL